jgi:hypothetical protein
VSNPTNLLCPGFPYPGGKIRLAPEIIKRIPKSGRTFIDVFGGRANITLRALHEGLQYKEWVLNDPLTAKFFEAIRDHGDTFVAAERSQEEYDRCKQLSRGGDPYALLMEPFLCWNGGSFKDNGMKGSGGGRGTAASHILTVRRAGELLRGHNVRIMNLDWLDCLKAHDLGPTDCVVIDDPYLNCDTGAYSPESICPVEVIEELKDAPYFWIFCEYYEPLYVAAFGQPVFTKTVQLKSANVDTTRDTRTECLWVHEPVAQRNVTVSRFIVVPEDRKKNYYTNLSVPEIMEEIKECIGSTSFSRNEMQKEIRLRLLPALVELKRRTFRGHPNYYESLAKIGLNPDTVRQWFYRSKTADDAIELLEEEKPEQPTKQRQDGRVTENMLLIGDGMAFALRDGKISQAKKLAEQWIEARS